VTARFNSADACETVTPGFDRSKNHDTPAVCAGAGPKAQRHPEIDTQRHVNAIEFGRRDSDDGIGMRFGTHGFSQHVEAAAEELLPGVVADNRRGLVFAVEPAAHQRTRSEDCRVIAGDRLGADQHRVAIKAEIRFFRIRSRETFKGPGSIGKPLVFGVRKQRIARAAQNYQALCVGHGQGAQVDIIDKAEYGRVDSDAEARTQPSRET